MMINKMYFERIIFILAGFILLFYPLLYWGYYAGDATTHLVFGQNAAHGHFFEFNEGEKTSGESSVAFMLLLGILFLILPATFVPVIVKIINYIAWILFLYIFYCLLQEKKFNKYIILLSLLALGLIPGSVYNSMVGMENIIFSLFIILWFYYALKYSYFSSENSLSKNEIIFSFIMGIGTWIRLEAILFFIIVIISRYFAFFYNRKTVLPILIRITISIISFLLPVLFLFLFIHWQSGGMWIQSSVLARTLQGKIFAYHIGPFLFEPTTLIRLVAYFPITVFWLFGIVAFFNSNWDKRVDEFFAISLFTILIFLFTFVVGVAQLGRYMIFLTPFWILIAARGIEHIYFNIPSTRDYVPCGILLFAALMFVYVAETSYRFKLGDDRALISIMESPYNMKKYSNELYAELRYPKKIPISIAFGEVDVRYKLDSRFLVQSLDGRIDSLMIKFFHKNSVDYIGYLKKKKIDFIAADFFLPAYKNLISAEKLTKLKSGEYFEVDGVRFSNIGSSNYFKITVKQ